MDSQSLQQGAHSDKEDDYLVRRLKASILRRAPMDAANLLMKQTDEIVSAVLQQTSPRITKKILRLLPAKRAELLSKKLPPDMSEQWELSHSYPVEAIGRLMEPPVGVITQDLTVNQTIEFIREQSEKGILFTYGYVVDEQQHLLGVIVIRDLLFASTTTPITELMVDNPFNFNANTPLQQAMLEVVHRHYPVYPVCDDDGVLIGLVQGYELFEEHALEVSAQPGMMVGVDNEEHLTTPITTSFRYRHPWLQLNLLTAFTAAFVVSLFENTIQQVVVLAAFLPVLAGQSGNTGCQALAVTLRGMTLGEFKKGQERKLILKELRLGAINGTLVGITAALGMLAYAMISGADSVFLLCTAVFLAMVCSCTASGMAGVLVPIMLKRFGADPVTASTIFLTTATDVVSMGLLLGLATILLI